MGDPTTRQSSPSHSDELRILNAVAEALNSSPDVQLALERTLSLVADLFGLRTGWVWLLDPDTQNFYSAAVRNLPPYLQEPVRMTGKPCTCIRSFGAGKLAPQNINMVECSRLQPAVQAHATDLTDSLRYHASIPLYFRDQPLGIMNVTSPNWRRLTPEELQLLSTIAYQVGIAIERARLAEESTRVARSEERTRIARELHDTLAQDLTAIILQLESALSSLEGQPDRARERLERALELSRQGLEEARRSVLDLRTERLTKPLAETLAGVARSFTSESGVRARVRTSGDLSLPPRPEAELLRVAQEALTNVWRHAGATEVEIVLRGYPQSVRLVIRDNGRGFEPHAVRGDHHGIVGMKERMKLLGGRLRVESGPGGGSVVTAVLSRES